jgi:hypothetical protein
MRIAKLTVLLALLLTGSAAIAYDINGTKWPEGHTTIFTGIPGTSPSGIPWSQALQETAEAWNNATGFQFEINSGYRDPCPNTTSGAIPLENLTGADFGSTACGSSFGSTTLAVTLTYYETNPLGTNDIFRSDVVFNSNQHFDIYDGYRPQSAGVDFRRVALHELGHVMGLGHEDRVPSIMAARISPYIYTLQRDDIDAVNALYSGQAGCPVLPLGFGSIDQRLSAGDCQVQQLVAGGGDDSFVDPYRLVLTEPARISLSMQSGTLDSVLVLTDSRFWIIDINDDASDQTCDSRIQYSLPAGTYHVLANTYVTATECGDNSGPYRLSVEYDRSPLRTLTGNLSFQGGESSAVFSGGATLDGGSSYTNRLRPTQPLDIRASIAIDPRHRNQPGFIVVAGLLDDGSILVKNRLGDFVAYNPAAALVPVAESRVLGALEQIDVLSGVTPAQLGVRAINVNFLVGYGLDSDPDELYFHQEPINLIVSP